MEVMIVSSTAEEVKPAMEFCKANFLTGENGYTRGTLTVRFLVTGIGMMRMAYHLGLALHKYPSDLCINAGIGGAFPGKLDIGDTVHIIEEQAIDLGAEDAVGNFLSPAEMGLPEDISTMTGLINPEASEYTFLPPANGVTVNTVLGTSQSIDLVIDSFDPDVVSMEGAAFFYACLKSGVRFVEMRSISNIVEPRDKSKWDIPLAIKNLNEELKQVLILLAS